MSMPKKYYLDELGLIKVLLDVSSAIKDKTSSAIDVQDVQDVLTGELVKLVLNPGNFATVGAVYDYVQEQSQNLIINKQSAIITPESYNVQDNILRYNGSELSQIDIKLVESTDIQRLFLQN